MHIERQKNLQNFNTLHLEAIAPYFGVFKNREEIQEYLKFADEQNLKVVILGSGSNVVLGNLEGMLILKNEIEDFTIQDENETSLIVEVGAGIIWDTFVAWTTEQNLWGVEALSFIPGTVGASPIQNIGAYGQEAKDTIQMVTTFDCFSKEIKTFANEECGFSYRNSVFKKDINRFIILSVLFKLNKNNHFSGQHYAGIAEALKIHKIDNPTSTDIRNIVIEIRQSKLPDWTRIYNVGSFFGNPHVSLESAEDLKKRFPDMQQFVTEDGIKIPAGWLIEHLGMKGFHEGNFGTYEKHALVIVHTGNGNFQELSMFRKKIVDKVYEKFGIKLLQEPIEIDLNTI